jgi:hypothetical protein
MSPNVKVKRLVSEIAKILQLNTNSHNKHQESQGLVLIR